MQVSLNWLRDYIEIDCTAEELAEKLTMAGVPVENLVRADAGFEKVVTGKVESMERHPDSDHLWVCQMNVGKYSPELLQIITGAQNVQTGNIVPVALVGADLPCGKKISKGKLRGVVSNGMLCSADELNLEVENAVDGIYILPDDTEIGIPASKVFNLDDVIFEFELTANRGDCFSVDGLIREIAVLTGKKFTTPDLDVKEDDSDETKDLIKIEIKDPDLCSRFSARVLKNVKLQKSPEWIQHRLEAAGIRSINNVVDVTNFVMVELGQPMHAYDYDQIAGKILTARRAIPNENLHTLDDSNRLAKGNELVIADSEKAAGLAGIMGGLETEITDKTTTVVLEAANFNSASIRRTSRAVGLHSEASGRFERGVDITKTIKALNRAAKLLQDMNSCTVTRGIVDCYPVKENAVSIEFTCSQINSRLGTNIDENTIIDILKSLGFEIETINDHYRAVVPSNRTHDVKLWEDLSEEVARIYGYDRVPSTLPFGDSTQGHQSDMQDFIDKIKTILSSLGMFEELSFGFTNPETFDKMQVPADSFLRNAIPIRDPLSDEYPLIRTSLLSGIFENAARNYSRKNEDVRLFEVAPVFYPKQLPLTELPNEVVKLAGLIMGRRDPIAWNSSNDEVDFYDMKGIVEELLDQLSISSYQVDAGKHFAMHPGKTAVFKKGKEVIATVGEVHPSVAKSFGISKKMYVFEMDVATLKKYVSKNFKYESLPKFPSIVRDISMLVDEKISAGDIEHTISKNAGKHFSEVKLFDLYQGKQITAGKKSLAYTIKFQSQEKTLTDAEVDEAFKNILTALQKKKKKFRSE